MPQPTASSGTRSIVFMNTIQTKIVSASGVTERRSPWKVSLTWPSTNSTMISTKACPLLGTPGVARRAASPNHRMNTNPSARPTNHESRLNCPPSTSTVLWPRWCWMYSFRPPEPVCSLTKDTLSFQNLGQHEGQRRSQQAGQHRQRGQPEPGQAEDEHHKHHHPLQHHSRQQSRDCRACGSNPATERHKGGDRTPRHQRATADQDPKRRRQAVGKEGQRDQRRRTRLEDSR